MDDKPKPKKNAELEEAKAHGGYSLKEILGAAAGVDDTKRTVLFNLLMVLNTTMPEHLKEHYLPREGTNPYESADCIVWGVMYNTATCLIAAAQGEDQAENINDAAEALVREVYELFEVHKRNAMREMTRQMFGPLIAAMGDGFKVMMVTEEGIQPLDMRDEPI